jgi:predicted ATPase
LGSPSEFLHIPRGQSIYCAIRGQFDLAERMDKDLLRLSQERNDPPGLVLAHYSCGRTLMFTGQLSASRSHLEKTLALYETAAQSGLVDQAGVDPYVSAQAILGSVLFYLGFPDQAVARSDAAIVDARRLGHQPSLAITLAFGARLRLLLGDNDALDETATQLLAVSTEQSFAYWSALGTIYRGWVAVNCGDVQEGIFLLQSGSTAYCATGAAAWVPFHLCLLAKAYEMSDQIEETVPLLDDALRKVDRTAERWFQAELNRYKGQLLQRQEQYETAEVLYGKAMSIAEEQGAKLWELRAAVSRCRLWAEQGRRIEARDLLVPLYDWFTEGFNTPDLQNARTLLEELR